MRRLAKAIFIIVYTVPCFAILALWIISGGLGCCVAWIITGDDYLDMFAGFMEFILDVPNQIFGE